RWSLSACTQRCRRTIDSAFPRKVPLTGCEPSLYSLTLSLHTGSIAKPATECRLTARRRARPGPRGYLDGASGALVREEMGLMRNRFGWLAVLVTVGAMLAPGTARAQDGNYNYDVGPPTIIVPTPFNQHMDQGGLYTAGEFNFWSQTNP